MAAMKVSENLCGRILKPKETFEERIHRLEAILGEWQERRVLW